MRYISTASDYCKPGRDCGQYPDIDPCSKRMGKSSLKGKKKNKNIYVSTTQHFRWGAIFFGEIAKNQPNAAPVSLLGHLGGGGRGLGNTECYVASYPAVSVHECIRES